MAIPDKPRQALLAASVSADPPHLLITGPVGVGKTAAWRLVARQVQMAHIRLGNRDDERNPLIREFVPLADLDDIVFGGWDPISPNVLEAARTCGVLEDADHLGSIRQAYLRRMMETVGIASRFVLVARAPSRIIDALRSRTQMIRIPATQRETMLSAMRSIAQSEGVETADGVLEDIAYICEGNLRKALFTLEMLHLRDLADDRSAVHTLVQSTTLQSGRHLLELALRGRVVEWRWENRRGRKKKVLAGALAEIDRMMNDHGMDSDDVVHQLHDVLVGRRLSLPDPLREQLLAALADCDAQLKRSMHARIPFENFLHRAARAGKDHGLAFG